MLIRELERLHQPHSLLGVAADWQVGYLRMPHDSFVADDEGGTQGNAFVAACVLLNAVILKQGGVRREEGRDWASVTWQIVCLTSASSGNLSLPMPPWLRGVLVHAKCTNSLSTLQPTRSQLLRQR
jgi:hypothetical protein